MDQTSSSPGPRYVLAGVIMALTLAAGLASNFYGWFVERVPPTKTPPTWPAFVQGQVTNEVADSMAKAPLPSSAASLERAASWLAVGDLGPRVRQGCHGWLFLADELTPHADGPANGQARARAAAALRDRLAARGVALFVAVVPDKTRIAADQLCGLNRPAAFAPRASDWTAALRAAGVPVLNLEPALRAVGDAAFLRTDTHWSEAGAQAAARAVADAIRALPAGRDALQPLQRYAITQGQPQQRAGDLIRLAGIDWLPARLLPPFDNVRPSTFRKAADAAASPDGGPDADALFGDAGLPRVALIGTSFSRNANFVPFLAAALETPVADYARDGGEFAGAAHAYFQSREFRDTPPRLVIWEIPERSLTRPLGGEPAMLPAP
ncbi:Alginate biosynthesis protein AlgX precursor [Pigmentiphaga humi]|uniref:Alginate biosynthesis protein AlgX n=1 Tax=Pigmentiphaga humi TaxID=2478468 RepID=A0A3P4B580_9BURK|nr:cell division protein FtsQ [Pigmentiphaga humi]VCU70686.1 Alginate biosynthesis protein AlgX precursor [Pigmentiphaga humi]